MDTFLELLVTVLSNEINDKAREHIYDQIIPELFELDSGNDLLSRVDLDDPVFEKSYSKFIRENV